MCHLLLSARFQAYCRDLHTEALTHVRDGAPAAHHEIESRAAELDPPRITLDVCREAQGALNGLVETIDRAVADQVETLTGTRPR